MPRKKWEYNVDEVELTHVQSGDMDNNVYYSYFSGNTKQKKAIIDKMLIKNALQDMIDKIFAGDISDDQLRKIMTAITVFDAVLEISNTSSTVTANDLFFATLVNWNASKGNGTNKIRSYSALQNASEAVKNNGSELDYREYIVEGEGDGKFNNDYVTILIAPKGYGNKMQVSLPIMPIRPKKLGLFRLATERVAGYMTIVGDPESNRHTLPPDIWLPMVQDGVNRRVTTKFSKLEGKHLTKLVSDDHKFIDEILAINDFHSLMHFMNAYALEFEDNGELILVNTEEPPEDDLATGFEWINVPGKKYWLKSPKFYVAATHGNSVHILVQ